MRSAPPRLARSKFRRVSVAGAPSNPHYDSPEHKAWRAAVKRRAGYTCEACGLANCRLYADHIIELKDGGAPLDLGNGWALCGACHNRKTAKVQMQRKAKAGGGY